MDLSLFPVTIDRWISPSSLSPLHASTHNAIGSCTLLFAKPSAQLPWQDVVCMIINITLKVIRDEDLYPVFRHVMGQYCSAWPAITSRFGNQDNPPPHKLLEIHMMLKIINNLKVIRKMKIYNPSSDMCQYCSAWPALSFTSCFGNQENPPLHKLNLWRISTFNFLLIIHLLLRASKSIKRCSLLLI